MHQRLRHGAKDDDLKGTVRDARERAMHMLDQSSAVWPRLKWV